MRKIKDIKENGSGVYFLYNKEKKLMYIGKAKNIYLRLRKHINTTWGDRAVQHYYHFAEYKLIPDPDERDKQETRLINKFKPPLNRAKVYTYKTSYYDMAKAEELEDWYGEVLQERIDKTMENFYL